jgi:hypothetical protein
VRIALIVLSKSREIPTSLTSPKSVPKWFRQLAENLLERDKR